MKLLALITALVGTFLTFNIAYAIRCDWANGMPACYDDGVSSPDYLEQTRYDWANGMPSQIYDSTAVDTTPVVGGGNKFIVSPNIALIVSPGVALIIP